MSLSHHVARMTGRDPAESHRASTPLELLFDLTFVVAFSQISSQTAHALELGHISTALIGFAFTTFAVAWAWINYSWLASAYDNDDIFFRIATLVVMIGVLVVALGVPPVFRSLEEGEHLDNGVAGRGLCHHAHRDGRDLAPRREARPRAATHEPGVRQEHRDRPDRLGRADLPEPAHLHDIRIGPGAHRSSSSPGRSSPN